VGDAHQLTEYFGSESFDAVFSISTFEHLAMPWKAVLEINRVLKPDGLVFVATHQAFPLHEAPWDYWRFSDSAWRALFNPATGFEILGTALGEEASVVGHRLSAASKELDLYSAYLGSAVIARKTGDTHLSWEVEPGLVYGEDSYPA